jgi:ADP-heptose:LPS heptosyltransferase
VAASNEVSVVLQCEGMGDCLYAIPVIKKMRGRLAAGSTLTLYTYHVDLFRSCPYVEQVLPIGRAKGRSFPKLVILFDGTKMPHWLVDTCDFMSIPVGIGQLSFREKQLEYFPREADSAARFDVVINTSMTWPSRSWPIENWQRLADHLVAGGHSVAVVGKDVSSDADKMVKKSLPLQGCTDLTNKLSLDQTYFTIRRAGLFVTCQNGLSVLSGATDTEVIVLDMSIEWSKRAIYRHEDPHYKAVYVKGACDIYCCKADVCPTYGEFRCLPSVENVITAVGLKLQAQRALAGAG